MFCATAQNLHLLSQQALCRVSSESGLNELPLRVGSGPWPQWAATFEKTFITTTPLMIKPIPITAGVSNF